MIQYADIVYDTIVDGVGLRNTLYVSGCNHNCQGCHNKLLQDFNYGYKEQIDYLAKMLTKENDNNLTFSGGEPFEQSNGLHCLIHKINEIDSLKGLKRNIWIYSGYTFEEIIQDKDKAELLKLCDVLVDGKFDINKKDLELLFRGSSNQRVIDLNETLKQNKMVEYNFGG